MHLFCKLSYYTIVVIHSVFWGGCSEQRVCGEVVFCHLLIHVILVFVMIYCSGPIMVAEIGTSHLVIRTPKILYQGCFSNRDVLHILPICTVEPHISECSDYTNPKLMKLTEFLVCFKWNHQIRNCIWTYISKLGLVPWSSDVWGSTVLV